MKTIKTIPVILMAAIMVLPALCLAMGPSTDRLPHVATSSAKPSVPLTITLEPLTPIAEGATVEVLVTVTSDRAPSDVEVTIRATGGARLMGTGGKWNVSVNEKGAPYSRTVTVSFPSHKGGALMARARMDRGDKGGRFSASTVLKAAEEPATAPMTEGPSSNGRKVMQQRGQ